MGESQTAIVVGAGPGLGLALVRCFAEAGMNVAMASRNPEKLAAIRPDDWGDKVRAYPTDATDEAAVQGLFGAVSNDFGDPDLVVFNAGGMVRGEVLELTAEEFERCWRVGCLGGFHVGQAAARRMLPRGRGTIIFTGATAALRGGAGFVGLAMPKFGLRALSQSMARELGPKGIHVAHVNIDGQIESERSRHLLEERGPDTLLKPEHIAETYLHLHRQPATTWTQEMDLRPATEKF